MKDFHNYSMIYTTVYCATQAQLGQALPYPHHWATRLSTKVALTPLLTFYSSVLTSVRHLLR